MLISGTIEATVLELATASIHGDHYHDLLIQTDKQRDRNEASRVRVATHACVGRSPKPGERVELRFLMQQVTEMRVLT